MRLIALVIFSMLAAVASADPWLCVKEDATGFIFKNGQWERGRFNAEDQKFILRKLKEGEYFFGAKNQTYGLFVLGNEASGLPCDNVSQPGYFTCLDSNSKFKFSTKSGRFLMTHTAGYLDGKDDADSALFISRGRCSKI